MKYSLLFSLCFVLIACGGNEKAASDQQETVVVEGTESMDDESTKVETTASTPSSNGTDAYKKLGKKYKNLVDANILSVEQAQQYSDLETEYREKRMKLQKEGVWEGKSEAAVKVRTDWANEKKQAIKDAFSPEVYQQIKQANKKKK